MLKISAKVTSKKLIEKYGKDEFLFSNPTDFPDPTFTEALYEPFVLGTVITPGNYLQICFVTKLRELIIN